MPKINKKNPTMMTSHFNSDLLDLLKPRENDFPRFDPDTKHELISEESGNELYLKGRQIFLKLASENKSRNIGIIDADKTTIWIERKRDRHLHRVSMSYGFNNHLMKLIPSVEKIILSDEKDTFAIPREVIIRQGRFMHFKDSADQNEYELQLFVPLGVLKRYSVR